MRVVLLRVIGAAALALGGSAGARAASVEACPCFHVNGTEVHDTYTEYSARNDCAAAVNFRSKAAQIGWTKWFEKGEAKTWRCEGGADRCGQLTWQRFDSCPTAAEERPEPRRKSAVRKPARAVPGHPKAGNQPETTAPAR